MKTQVTTTDVFVSVFMGQDGLLKMRPVSVRDLTIASINFYGETPWSENDYNFSSLSRFAEAHGWKLDLYEDDEDFRNRWISFLSLANRAQALVVNALRQVEEGNF